MDHFFYKDNAGRETGPFPLSTLVKLRSAGVLRDGTPLRKTTSSVWSTYGEAIASFQVELALSPVEKKGAAGFLLGKRTARWFRSLPFLFAILCFFLPFVMVSCNSNPHEGTVSISGFQLAIGKDFSDVNPISGDKEIHKVQGNKQIALALVFCLLAGGAGLAVWKQSKLVPGLLGAVGLAMLFLARAKMDADFLKEAQGLLVLKYQSGFYLTCVFMFIGSGISLFQFFCRDKSPVQTVLPTQKEADSLVVSPPVSDAIQSPAHVMINPVSPVSPASQAGSTPPVAPMPPIDQINLEEDATSDEAKAEEAVSPVPPATEKPLVVAKSKTEVVSAKVPSSTSDVPKNIDLTIEEINADKAPTSGNQQDKTQESSPAPIKAPKTSEPHTGLGVIVGAIAVVLLIVGILAFNKFCKSGSKKTEKDIVVEQVQQHLTKQSQKVVSVKLKNKASASKDSKQYEFNAKIELMEPLYAKTNYPLPSVFQQIASILNDKNAQRLKEMAGIVTIPSLDNAIFLVQTAPSGFVYSATGVVEERHEGTETQYTIQDTPITNSNLGLSIGEFKGLTIRCERQEDLVKFASITNAAVQTLAKLEQAKTKLAEEIQIALERYQDDCIGKIQKGALFRGAATNKFGQSVPIYLEITDLNKDHKVISGLLRNDGAWAEARNFRGNFAFDGMKSIFSVDLSTQPEDAIRDCGPFLGYQEGWTIHFVLNNDTLFAKNDNWSYSLTRVADSGKEAVIASVLDFENRWLAATRKGTCYRVTATLPDQTWNEKYLLIFDRQAPKGAFVEATLVQPNRRWKRHFRGSLELNWYKSNGKPLQLVSDAADYVAEANQEKSKSPFAKREQLAWYPQLESEGLSFNGQWQLRFEEVSVEEARKIESNIGVNQNVSYFPANAAAAVLQLDKALAQQPAGILKSGSDFEGFMCARNGSGMTGLRLHIGDFGSNAAASCILSRLDKPSTSRTMRGKILNGNILMLSPSGTNIAVKDGANGVVFDGNTINITLFLTPSGLVGSVKQNNTMLLLHPTTLSSR